MSYRDVINNIKVFKSFPIHVKFIFAKVVQVWEEEKKDIFTENRAKM